MLHNNKNYSYLSEIPTFKEIQAKENRLDSNSSRGLRQTHHDLLNNEFSKTGYIEEKWKNNNNNFENETYLSKKEYSDYKLKNTTSNSNILGKKDTEYLKPKNYLENNEASNYFDQKQGLDFKQSKSTVNTKSDYNSLNLKEEYFKDKQYRECSTDINSKSKADATNVSYKNEKNDVLNLNKNFRKNLNDHFENAEDNYADFANHKKKLFDQEDKKSNHKLGKSKYDLRSNDDFMNIQNKNQQMNLNDIQQKKAQEELLKDDIYLKNTIHSERKNSVSKSFDKMNDNKVTRSKSVSWNSNLEQHKHIYKDETLNKQILNNHTASLLAFVSNCNNTLVEEILKKIGFVYFNNEKLFEKFKNDNKIKSTIELYWDDKFISMDKFIKLKSYQIMNHFPGMFSISGKSDFIKNITKLQAYTSEFNFVPMSWNLPEQLNTFKSFCKNKFKNIEKSKEKFYIQKCISQNKITKLALFSPGEGFDEKVDCIIQEYIRHPLLINKKKFHIRLYALVTCMHPMQIFRHHLGIVYICRENYDSSDIINMQQHCQSLNKKKGDKSTLFCSTDNLKYYLGAKKVDAENIWHEMDDIIVKSMLVGHPQISSCMGLGPVAASCFEMLAFDFIIDEKLKPWLLAVKQSPSMKTRNDLELEIKSQYLMDALTIIIKRHSNNTINNYNTNTKETNKDKPNKDEKLDKLHFDINIKNKIICEAKQMVTPKETSGFQQIFPTKDSEKLNRYINILNSCYEHINLDNSLVDRMKQKIEEKHEKEQLLKSNSLSKNKLIQLSEASQLTILSKLKQIVLILPKKTAILSEKVIQNYFFEWEEYKLKIANYWFVDLNYEKHKKIINMVKEQVDLVLKETLSVENSEEYELVHTFQRLYNRLLADRGNGLWECLHTVKEPSWMIMMSKSSRKLSKLELECCQQIVQLACHALLIAFHTSQKLLT